MIPSNTVLINTAVIVELPEGEDEDTHHERLDTIRAALVKAVEEVAATQTACRPTRCCGHHYLGDEGENAFRCSRCGIWATDFDRPDRIGGIPEGCVKNGVFVCWSCHEALYPEEYLPTGRADTSSGD
jgi:hypothetical protein